MHYMLNKPLQQPCVIMNVWKNIVISAPRPAHTFPYNMQSDSSENSQASFIKLIWRRESISAVKMILKQLLSDSSKCDEHKLSWYIICAHFTIQMIWVTGNHLIMTYKKLHFRKKALCSKIVSLLKTKKIIINI